MNRKRKPSTENPAKPSLSPAQTRKAHEKDVVVSLYMKGHSMEAAGQLAGEQLGRTFSRQTVGQYVAEAIAKWQGDKDDLIRNHKAIELEKINRLEITYWQAWEKSCAIVTTKRKIKKREGESERLKLVQASSDVEQGLGDPRYLQGIHWCIDKRCMLLGVDVPQTAIQINNNSAGSTTVIRRVVFKTRETTTMPQIITQQTAE